jgi:UDP:flavonoid glycosyltransferase YjiC (YdhE family)
VARFLFVVPPLTGHTNPTVSVASELEARGHEVAWCGHRQIIEPLLPDGATLLAVGDDVSTELVEEMHEKARGLRGPKALKFLW